MSVRSSDSQSNSALASWARYAVRHRGRVLLAWVAAWWCWVCSPRPSAASTPRTSRFPGTESQRATDLLKERFPSQAGDSATIVVQTDAGVERPGGQAANHRSPDPGGELCPRSPASSRRTTTPPPSRPTARSPTHGELRQAGERSRRRQRQATAHLVDRFVDRRVPGRGRRADPRPGRAEQSVRHLGD